MGLEGEQDRGSGAKVGDSSEEVWREVGEEEGKGGRCVLAGVEMACVLMSEAEMEGLGTI